MQDLAERRPAVFDVEEIHLLLGDDASDVCFVDGEEGLGF
jgi:hypothetical protein